MPAPAARSRLLRAAVAGGREPAEALCPADRRAVLLALLAAGWTAAEIAVHTRTSTYTLHRWLDSYGLRTTTTQEGGHAA